MSAPTNSSTAPSSTEDASASKTDTYSATFPLSDDADVVIRSSDGVLFATQKFYLQAASPIFEDVLKMGSEGEKRDGKPLVQLHEKADALEPFFRLVHRDQLIRDGDAPVIDVALLKKLSPIVDKYQAVNLGWILYERCLQSLLLPKDHVPPATVSDIASLLALAIIHEKEKSAKAVLRNVGTWLAAEDGSTVLCHSDAAKPDLTWTSRRYIGIEDMPEDLLYRIPAKTIKQLALLNRKVSTRPSYTSQKAADDFKVRPSSVSLFCMWPETDAFLYIVSNSFETRAHQSSSDGPTPRLQATIFHPCTSCPQSHASSPSDPLRVKDTIVIIER